MKRLRRSQGIQMRVRTRGPLVSVALPGRQEKEESPVHCCHAKHPAVIHLLSLLLDKDLKKLCQVKDKCWASSEALDKGQEELHQDKGKHWASSEVSDKEQHPLPNRCRSLLGPQLQVSQDPEGMCPGPGSSLSPRQRPPHYIVTDLRIQQSRSAN